MLGHKYLSFPQYTNFEISTQSNSYLIYKSCERLCYNYIEPRILNQWILDKERFFENETKLLLQKCIK